MSEIITLKTAASEKLCPMCSQPESSEFRPFCCKHCADVDLGKWLKEDYRIASREEANFDDDNFDQEKGEP